MKNRIRSLREGTELATKVSLIASLVTVVMTAVILWAFDILGVGYNPEDAWVFYLLGVSMSSVYFQWQVKTNPEEFLHLYQGYSKRFHGTILDGYVHGLAHAYLVLTGLLMPIALRGAGLMFNHIEMDYILLAVAFVVAFVFIVKTGSVVFDEKRLDRPYAN